jgi:2-methylcitrate dehydratase
MSSLSSPGLPAPDKLLVEIADYVLQPRPASEEALDTARWCLADSLACGIMALAQPECTKLLGPIVPGTTLANGARVPGTRFELDPVQGAFNIGTTVRWLDLNDTWIAAEYGHPSDNLGAILATADWLSRNQAAGQRLTAFGSRPPIQRASLTMREVLIAMVKAHEIQGVLALDNSFGRVGLDHVVLVRVASTAVTTALLGGTREQIINAVSHAWLDGSALRTYRQSPTTGTRKSWAAGDATSRAVRLALIAMTGEMGYPSALTAKNWGFNDVCFKGNLVRLVRPLGSYVMEQILFKVSHPVEFHGQTAVECAVALYPLVKQRLDKIDRIEVTTQASALRVLDKAGPLSNTADRERCLRYMIAVTLIYGGPTLEHYDARFASDPRIEVLRAKMVLTEDAEYTKGFSDPEKRSIANAVQIFFKDGTKTDKIEIEYSLGHRRRRKEGLPLLQKKAEAAFASHYGEDKSKQLMALFANRAKLEAMPVHEFSAAFVKQS